VQRAKDWPFSTLHRYVRDEVYPENWGGIPEGQVDEGTVFGEPENNA
jgi:putative transposase